MSLIVDVSGFQSHVEFSKLKQHGVTAVYVKATEGLTFVNPLLHQQFSAAEKAGLIPGTYHFGRQDLHPALTPKTRSDAENMLPVGEGYIGVSQEKPLLLIPVGSLAPEDFPDEMTAARGADMEAEHYVRTMRELHKGRHAWRKGDLRPVLDFEVGTANKRYSPWRDRFFHTIASATRHSTILYTFPAFNAWRSPPPHAAQLWIADFRPRKEPGIPAGYTAWAMWQFTSHGRPPGANGLIDISRLPEGKSINTLRCTVEG